MPGKFNQKLWTMGHNIENNIYPLLNKKLNCNFKRSNDIFDVFDFCDNNKKIIVEIKGRNTPSNKYKETIVSYNKVQEGYRKLDDGYKVFFVFVFTDKTMYIELKESIMWEVKLTGSYGVAHALIPVKNLMDFDCLDEPEPEPLALEKGQFHYVSCLEPEVEVDLKP